MCITGTFLDEISHDIPSSNWGATEWAADFDAMKAVGIDTVILIRCGYKDRSTFESKSLKSNMAMRPVYDDLVDLFLNEAERCGMSFYFGLYDSGKHWAAGEYQKEIDINLRLTEEVIARYGERTAFQGWYMSHELTRFDEELVEMYLKLSRHLKALKNIPILMSPYIQGCKQFEQAITPEQHEKEWDNIFANLSGFVDSVAFQDGQVDFCELPKFLNINAKLAQKYGFSAWSNIESFERGMPIDFLPIAWPNMRYKMESAMTAGYEKLITFEFSHFMSPYSPYPAAHNLYNRYSEWISHKVE